MSVAGDSVHHTTRPFEPSPADSRNPQEYGNNHETQSIINKGILDGTRLPSPLAVLPNAATQNYNNKTVVEDMSDNAAFQSHHNAIRAPPSSSSPLPNNNNNHNSSHNNPQPKMRSASHNTDAARLPSPSPAAIAPSPSGSQSPKLSKLQQQQHEITAATTTAIQDASPVLTPSNSTISTAPAEETPQPPTKTRPKVATLASPPPSPPSGAAAAASAVGGTAGAGAGTGGMLVDSPMTLQSTTAPHSSVATPVRSGSLASLLHSAHRDVDVPETISEGREGSGGAGMGTPLSPTSMSQGGTHSRKDSAATMVSASTTGTAVDSPSKSSKEGGEPMDVDLPPPRSAGSTSNTPTGLGSKSQQQQQQQQQQQPASRSPQPGGMHHRPHLSPSPPTPTPMSSHPPKMPYSQSAQSTARPSTPTTTAGSGTAHQQHQRRHSLSRAQHSHSRSYSGRGTANMTGTNSTTNSSGGGGAPLQTQTQTQTLQTPQPRPLSPASQLSAFRRPDMAAPSSATSTTAVDERDSGEFITVPVANWEELQRQISYLSLQNEDLRASRDYHTRLYQRLQQEENTRAAYARNVTDWIRTGEALLSRLSDAVAITTPGASYNGRPHEESARHSAGGVSLSSAMVSDRQGGSGREIFDRLERDKTLSVVTPSSPYTPAPHGRPTSGYGQEPYPLRSAATPTHSETSAHLSRTAAQAPRPTHNANSHSHSLRRSRRPSSDDIAEHGGKRMRTNNGTSVRTSPDAAERASYHHLGPSGLTRTSAMGMVRDNGGDIASYPTSHHRGSGSLGSGTEHGRESPVYRRLLAGKDEEDEEFPSPRRSYAAPAAPSATGNGNGISGAAGRPARDARVSALAASTAAGDDADALGSPDIDTTGHESLMEMVDEEDTETPRRGQTLRHVRGSVMRNGSRSSMNSQDIDDMIAEVAEDDPSRRGNGSIRPSAKTRYRGPNQGASSQPGGAVATFPVHLGPHSEALSPGQTRSYTPSSQPTSSKFITGSSASQPPNSRGFVFRNTDVADMEAQAQARSPEDIGHRPSLSGSGSFTGAQSSPPGASGNPVAAQFLPPQSGPPQPKKIYHNKGTGQVIGSQHAAMMNPAPSVPVETAPRPSQPIPPTSSFTMDGLPKRTCKQCGQPGRYKDNKCVEKWGPGPQGPGTVCDRCRKKMKRVEKRATQDSAAMNAALNHHQYPIAPAPSGSFSQLSNQGSQRFEEAQEYGYSQATEDAQSQPTLSRSASHNHSSMHLSRRAPEQSMHRDATLPYPPHPSSSAREMPPPTSFSGTYSSPKSGRTNVRERSADARDGDLDADGDAEMDELVDEDFNAAADAVVAGASSRRRDQGVKPEA